MEESFELTEIPNHLSNAGIYFAGEILYIDCVTGGFNFHSAWTTDFLAGKNCAS